MKLNDIREKTIRIIDRIGRRGTVAICAVILVGVAVLLNLLLFPAEESGGKLAIDPSALTAASGMEESGEEQQPSEPVYNFFEAMELSRQQARDEAMEVLLTVAESSTALPEMKDEAMGNIAQIAADMEHETNIETLILAKGFSRCVAVVNGENASVIVKSTGLLPNEIAQISEIVYEQTGILPVNLKIIEKDV